MGEADYEVRVVVQVEQPNGPFYVEILDEEGKSADPATYTVTPANYPIDGLISFIGTDRWLIYPGYEYLITLKATQSHSKSS